MAQRKFLVTVEYDRIEDYRWPSKEEFVEDIILNLESANPFEYDDGDGGAIEITDWTVEEVNK